MPAFADVANIRYEGPDSKNPLAFRCYNAREPVEGKSLRDHLREKTPHGRDHKY